ncbi:MAG: endonuclease/exonuclease/phosphatase family protein [Bacteroidales bacterium]
MAGKIKIATFNCENLFNRITIFRESEQKAHELLEAVDKLNAELKKPVFDQAEIARLKTILKGFASINDIKNKHTTAGIGAREWFGWIEYNQQPAEDASIQNLARVIAETDADIICLIEVENRTVLQKFHDDILYKHYLKPFGKRKYEHIMLIDANDPRGIDVSLMSRLPIISMKSYLDDTTSYLGKITKTFSRDCLHVTLDIGADRPLNLFINHLKSQGYSGEGDPGGNIRREGQAKRVAEIINTLDLQNDLVIVAGDLNCDPSNNSLAPLLNRSDLFNLNMKLPPDERGTYLTGKKQLDYLIVTKPLEKRMTQLKVIKRGIFKYPDHYPTVTDKVSQASDHAAVVAEFDF